MRRQMSTLVLAGVGPRRFGTFHFLLFADPVELVAPIELTHQDGILAPARLDAHERLQKNLRAENFLQLLARQRPDILDRLAVFADQDSLLPFALDANRRANANQVLLFLEAIDQHRNGVWHLFASRENGLLADDFRSQKSFGLVGELAGWEIRRNFGQIRKPALHQVETAFSRQRGNRKNLGKVEFAAVAVDQRQQRRLLHAIDFVEQQE